MNKTLAAILIIFMVLGWFSLLLSFNNKEDRLIAEHLETASDYMDRKLYQLAAKEYDAALKIRKDESVWKDELNAYQLLLEENDDIYDEYLDKSKSSFADFPQNVDFALNVVELYKRKDNYVTAYRFLSKAMDNGLKDDRVTEALFNLKYQFRTGWSTYESFKEYTNGYFIVGSGENWNYIDGTGKRDFEIKLVFAGPVGEKGIRLVKEKESKIRLIDENSVIQGFVDFVPEECRPFSEGFIALKNDKGYSFYDSLGDIQFDGAVYEDAGTFVRGQAAVKKDNKWFLINTEGNPVSDATYEEIVLHWDGSHIKKDVMIVKENGKYNIYNKDVVVGTYDDVGVPSADGLIAVKDGDKWGYIDAQGNVVIEPRFAEARSFSNGLAAVRKGDKWGFIDSKGQLAIDYQFFDVGYFNEEGSCMALTSYSERMNDDKTTTEFANWQLISLYNT